MNTNMNISNMNFQIGIFLVLYNDFFNFFFFFFFFSLQLLQQHTQQTRQKFALLNIFLPIEFSYLLPNFSNLRPSTFQRRIHNPVKDLR